MSNPGEQWGEPSPAGYGPTRLVRLDATDQTVPVPLCRSNDHLIFESDRLRIGLLDIDPDHPRFRFSGVPGLHMMFFPHRSVLLQRLGEEPCVCDPMLVHFFNPDQIYFRQELQPEGCRGVLLVFEAHQLRELLEGRLDGGRRDLERQWPWRCCPADPWSFLTQAELAAQLTAGTATDARLVEALALELATRALHRGPDFRDASEPPTRNRGDAQSWRLVDRTRRLLALEYADALNLGEIAQRIGSSVSTLGRCFRRTMAAAVHQYRVQLRLRAALLELYRPATDLTDLALRTGFSSHSHFTGAFREHFSVTPSWVAKPLVEERLRYLLRLAPATMTG